jgi:UDPglucose 6-dehydrogenase
MKLAMIGVGYVGLVTGVGFAEFGNEVICADTDQDKIEKLSRGELPIYEPGLDRILESNVDAGRLSFTSNICQAVEDADAIFICVGTPQAEDGSADLSAVYNVARKIGEGLKRTQQLNKVVVVKSTCPVGTAQAVDSIISSYSGGPSCVATNPEFLREGTAIEDFMRPDRVVIGTNCNNARETLLRLYRPVTSITKILVMDPASAELIKYAANAMLATRITFMNELSNLAAVLGADINRVREGVGADFRIGPKYLYPGPGYGGSCLPKDVSALLAMASSSDVNLKVVKAAKDGNDDQRALLGRLVMNHFNGNVDGKRIAVWGLSFKAETDDIRDSPALTFVDQMINAGAHVVAHDPKAISRAKAYFDDKVEFVEDMYDAVDGANALAVCTEWREYRSPDIAEILRRSRQIAVFDGRNIWDKDEFLDSGIPYTGICRPSPKSARVHTSDYQLEPVRMLDASRRMVPSRRPLPLQNGSVYKTGT